MVVMTVEDTPRRPRRDRKVNKGIFNAVDERNEIEMVAERCGYCLIEGQVDKATSTAGKLQRHLEKVVCRLERTTD